MTGTDRYAVMGDPVAHSKSPRIHALFAAQTGQRLEYTAERVASGTLAQALAAFAAAGGRGCNVTVPLKQEAWALAAPRTPRAELAGAVNTLRRDRADGWWGDNTDGIGLVRDLVDNLGEALAGRALLVLGAGGAVRGILGPLLEAGPSRLLLVNRTAARAQALAAHFAALGPVQAGGFELLQQAACDVVINGTAASLHGAALPLPESLGVDGALAYDLMYAAEPTPFLRWAAAHGARRCADGLGMLVEQAAEAFALWRGVRPQTAPVIAELRQG
ncbi:MAG TPA: shikimate dehydrogenase [Gammaproteobacteria bacterium]